MNDYAINHRASRPLLDGAVLDTAIDEAIAVTGALLYWLPAGDAAWPEVALTLGRLSYDRYTDPWPGAEPPDPDDLDAACDLLLRGARYDDADERTTLYLFLALRDRQHLMACPGDGRALMTWGERLMSFPEAGASASPACTTCWSWNCSTAPMSRAARGAPGASGPPG